MSFKALFASVFLETLKIELADLIFCLKDEISETVKASELASKSDLLFIRNSLTGSIQCRPNKKVIELNEELHSND